MSRRSTQHCSRKERVKALGVVSSYWPCPAAVRLSIVPRENGVGKERHTPRNARLPVALSSLKYRTRLSLRRCFLSAAFSQQFRCSLRHSFYLLGTTHTHTHRSLGVIGKKIKLSLCLKIARWRHTAGVISLSQTAGRIRTCLSNRGQQGCENDLYDLHGRLLKMVLTYCYKQADTPHSFI